MYSPEKIIQPHLLNMFTLKHDLRTFVEKNVASRIYALLWAKSLRTPGLGSAFDPVTPPLEFVLWPAYYFRHFPILSNPFDMVF